ncbi:hypothetical protein DPMN_045274 [Dreissena polymorpha]|uniref:Uncharacterized protein n=1 Tax=Dreissena polymorpha TaxID=45954 RepID=A0A9D4D5Y1_DREPO|nr:hypothetical protein DPMN_045274 [Dreissena polymorpha]
MRHADTESRIQAFEHKCLRRLLRISYTVNKTNDYFRNITATLNGQHELLSYTVKRRKLGLDTSPLTTLCAMLFSSAC